MVLSAHELRILKIFAPDVYDWILALSLAQAVGTYTWPKLREIGLSNMSSSANDIVDFLLRHKSTLPQLSLSNLRLTTGSGIWEAVFDRIAGSMRPFDRSSTSPGHAEVTITYTLFSKGISRLRASIASPNNDLRHMHRREIVLKGSGRVGIQSKSGCVGMSLSAVHVS